VIVAITGAILIAIPANRMHVLLGRQLRTGAEAPFCVCSRSEARRRSAPTFCADAYVS
jgi:hypothetical protein